MEFKIKKSTYAVAIRFDALVPTALYKIAFNTEPDGLERPNVVRDDIVEALETALAQNNLEILAHPLRLMDTATKLEYTIPDELNGFAFWGLHGLVRAICRAAKMSNNWVLFPIAFGRPVHATKGDLIIPLPAPKRIPAHYTDEQKGFFSFLSECIRPHVVIGQELKGRKAGLYRPVIVFGFNSITPANQALCQSFDRLYPQVTQDYVHTLFSAFYFFHTENAMGIPQLSEYMERKTIFLQTGGKEVNIEKIELLQMHLDFWRSEFFASQFFTSDPPTIPLF